MAQRRGVHRWQFWAALPAVVIATVAICVLELLRHPLWRLGQAICGVSNAIYGLPDRMQPLVKWALGEDA